MCVLFESVVWSEAIHEIDSLLVNTSISRRLEPAQTLTSLKRVLFLEVFTVTKRIWKYQLSVAFQQTIVLPKGSRILSVHAQDGMICLWAMVDPDLRNWSSD
jgi:hypothetical protein